MDDSMTVIAGVRVATKITGALNKGNYLVTYRVVSEDGHPVKESFFFSIK